MNFDFVWAPDCECGLHRQLCVGGLYLGRPFKGHREGRRALNDLAFDLQETNLADSLPPVADLHKRLWQENFRQPAKGFSAGQRVLIVYIVEPGAHRHVTRRRVLWAA